MGDGTFWVMRPVVQGMISYESLMNGTVNLGDIAACNEALDVVAENEFRAQEAASKKWREK